MGISAIDLFSGAGGLSLAARWAGIRTNCYVEWDIRAQATLINRIAGGHLDDAPIWDDVNTFDSSAWRGKVDIVFGGFPCQPHSSAGKGLGESDERNLWPQTLGIIVKSGAWGFVGENVIGIVRNGFIFSVLADLEREGFQAAPFRITSCAVGGSHARSRVFIVAYSKSKRKDFLEQDKKKRCANEYIPRTPERKLLPRPKVILPRTIDIDWSNPRSGVCRVDDGMDEGLDRIKLCGNGVDPYAGIHAFKKLREISGI